MVVFSEGPGLRYFVVNAAEKLSATSAGSTMAIHAHVDQATRSPWARFTSNASNILPSRHSCEGRVLSMNT